MQMYTQRVLAKYSNAMRCKPAVLCEVFRSHCVCTMATDGVWSPDPPPQPQPTAVQAMSNIRDFHVTAYDTARRWGSVTIDQAGLSLIEAGRGFRLQLGFGRSVMVGADTRV